MVEYTDVCKSRFKNMAKDIVGCDQEPRKHLLHSGVSKGERYQWHTKDEYCEPLPVPPTIITEVVDIDPYDVIDAWELDFYEGSALVYLAKHSSAKDLDKAIHYLQLLKERKYPDAL